MTDPKTHAERMAELLAIYDEHKSAGLIQAIDYADSIAAQLEAERSVNAFALTEQVSGIENERDLWWAYRDATKELKAAEEKLRAAEGVVEWCLSKHICPGCNGCTHRHEAEPHEQNCPLVTNGFVTIEGKRTDAINPDGSTGGAGEGVG